MIETSTDAAPSALWEEIVELPTPEPPPWAPAIGPAVGFLVAAGLMATGRATAAIVLVLVISALTALRLLLPAADRVVDRALQAVARVVGAALSAVLLGAAFVVLVLPVWAIGRVLRWDHLDRGTGWQRRIRPWQSLPTKPFADEWRERSTASRLHGAAVVAIPLAALLVLGGPLRDETLGILGDLVPGHPTDVLRDLWGDDAPSVETDVPVTPSAEPSRDAAPLPGTPPSHGPTTNLLPYPDEPWVLPFFEQLGGMTYPYDPYLTVRPADYASDVVNVHDRVRASYEPDGVDGPDAITVWVFGSSALFGAGSRDLHTIPSELARAAEKDGIVLRVQNFGVPSYYAWQDAILLAQMLTERSGPDLIVTYEGHNEMFNSMFPGAPTEISTQFAEEVRSALLAQGASLMGLPDDADLVGRTSTWSPENAATMLNRGVRFSRLIAAGYGIPIVQFEQPALWTRSRPEDVATYENIGTDAEFHAAFSALWDEARALVDDDVIDLGDVLDDEARVVYSDMVHHDEAAAAIIGSAMFDHLRPALAQILADR